MTGSLALLAVGLFVAFVGHVGAHLLTKGRGSASLENDGVALASGLEAVVLRFLLGFGLVSLGLFGLVYLDCFTRWGLGIAMAVPIGLALAMFLRAPTSLAFSLIGRDLAVGMLLALLALGFGWLLPAYDLTLAGSDGSVYLAAAHQLAAGGHLQHRDELVTEMTADERTVLFEQTSGGRLPGGIPLLDRAAGRVSFSFYHLLPAWLAFGLRTTGRDGDLRVWSLFPVLSLCSSFLLGRRLGGKRWVWRCVSRNCASCRRRSSSGSRPRRSSPRRSSWRVSPFWWPGWAAAHRSGRKTPRRRECSGERCASPGSIAFPSFGWA